MCPDGLTRIHLIEVRLPIEDLGLLMTRLASTYISDSPSCLHDFLGLSCDASRVMCPDGLTRIHLFEVRPPIEDLGLQMTRLASTYISDSPSCLDDFLGLSCDASRVMCPDGL